MYGYKNRGIDSHHLSGEQEHQEEYAGDQTP